MSRPVSFNKSVFVSLALTCAGAWWGCSTTPGETSGTSSTTSQSTTTGKGGAGGTDIVIDGGAGGSDEDVTCFATTKQARHIPLDIVFVIDQSASMAGLKWTGTVNALTAFWNDAQSVNIGAGLSIFPNNKPPKETCVPEDYISLNVPIDVLPQNAFNLTNSLPAEAKGNSTPTYGALKGALMAATAHQDANPSHKVIVVLATDGDPNSCGLTTIVDVANVAKSARSYNGVLTYVIGVAGSIIANLDKIAEAGGTKQAYDITHDVTQFFEKITEIRQEALGCDFELPEPGDGQTLDPNKVNFTYTPKGMGTAKTLLRADDLSDCNGKPGWYYDNNTAPSKIILCPASCTTVQADANAKVNVLFGCQSLIN